MRSLPHPTCIFCGSAGDLIYTDLRDCLFGTPGIWKIRRCPRSECGLLWLDPLPVEEDIEEAYDRYYTHGPSDTVKRPFAVFSDKLRQLYHWLLRLTKVASEREKLDLGYLTEIAAGKVLDVGCGDGSRLSRLRAKGWNVQGQELDIRAAKIAREHYGVPVHVGALKDAPFRPEEFDAIIMFHVIEHVHDPVSLLANCNRLLKRGGTLVVLTPNSRSYGHKIFRSHWRGLEPPRHLQIFSPDSLCELGNRAGVGNRVVWTTAANAHHFVIGSYQIRRTMSGTEIHGLDLVRMVSAAVHQLGLSLLHRVAPDSGEECVLKVVKEPLDRPRQVL
jgi:2-polyprenyl-3-methyl-5-hydroxy-6-metoxy-1,4-benzoquinol methylase